MSQSLASWSQRKIRLSKETPSVKVCGLRRCPIREAWRGRKSEAHLIADNVQGKLAAAKNLGIRKTRRPPLGLTDLLGGVRFIDLSIAKSLSARRQLVCRQLFSLLFRS